MTVPVPGVKVPELTQFPPKVMEPVVALSVPALVTSPGTINVPVFTLKLEPEGTIIPEAKEFGGKIRRPIIKKRRGRN